jgi:hypothetical protein
MTDERLIAVKSRAAAQFAKIPGVTGVGLGGRERDGRPTGELVIKVFVRRKRPPEVLTPGELLPPQFEGIGVDVSVLGEAHQEMSNPLLPEAAEGTPYVPETDIDKTRYRPLIGGALIQSNLLGTGAGTGGSFWVNTADPTKVYLLTNYHVISSSDNPTAPVGSPVSQPLGVAPLAAGLGPRIGTFAGGDRQAPRDAALVQLDPGTEYFAEIHCMGVISPTTHDVDPVSDLALLTPYPVRKYGMRTGLTGGTVEAVMVEKTVDNIHRTNLMVTTPNVSPEVKGGQTLYFNDHGDSGAALVNDDNQIVGLHFAGDDDTALVHKSLALPIKDIIDRFADPTAEGISIRPATADRKGQVQKVPPAAPPPAPDRQGAMMARPVPGPGALARVDADLAGSAAGRRLRALWADHHTELLGLVEHRQRVAVAWQRGGGPVILDTLLRMAADPALAMPATINGQPPMRRIASLHAVFHANASPQLRRTLDHALAAVPDPATLTYDQLLAAIAAR